MPIHTENTQVPIGLKEKFEIFLIKNYIFIIPEERLWIKKERVKEEIREEEKIPRIISSVLSSLYGISFLIFLAAMVIAAVAGIFFPFLSWMAPKEAEWFGENVSFPLMLSVILAYAVMLISEYLNKKIKINYNDWEEIEVNDELMRALPPSYKKRVEIIRSFDTENKGRIEIYLGVIKGREEMYLAADLRLYGEFPKRHRYYFLFT